MVRMQNAGMECMPSVLWEGDGMPTNETVASLASLRRDASVRNTAPNSFEHCADTLAVQERRRRFGWKTVEVVNIYQSEFDR